jgi:hypothetical protein
MSDLQPDTHTNTAHTVAPETWPDLEPVELDQPRLPKLDTDLIPESIRPWILDNAKRLGVWPEQIFGAATIAAATLIGSAFRIQGKAHDTSYIVLPNLWGMVIAEPGTKKSPAMKIGTKFVDEMERRQLAAYADAAPNRRARKQLVERQIAELTKSLDTVKNGAAPSNLGTIEAQLEALETEADQLDAPAPRLTFNDATMEILQKMLAQNPNGLAGFFDELGSLFDNLSKTGREAERSFLLQAADGGRPFTIDRIGRGTTHAARVTVSMYGGIQPDVLRDVTRGLTRGTGEDGLFSRFQLLLKVRAEDQPYEVDAPADEDAENLARATYYKLHDLAGTVMSQRGSGEYETIRLAPDAQQLMDEYRESLNDRRLELLAAKRRAFAAHVAKSGDRALRLALVLHMIDAAAHAVHTAAAPLTLEVSLDEARSATRLMDFYLQHAADLYEVADPLHSKAVDAANFILRGKLPHRGTLGNLQGGVKSIKSAQEARLVAEHLEQRGWLRLVEVKRHGVRTSTLIELHPELRTEEPDSLDTDDRQLN